MPTPAAAPRNMRRVPLAISTVCQLTTLSAHNRIVPATSYRLPEACPITG
jgi:hypothetical protein